MGTDVHDPTVSDSTVNDSTVETPFLAQVRLLSACVSVASLDASVDWYVERLGFEVLLTKDFPEMSARLAYLRYGDLVIELVESRPSVGIDRPPPSHHAMVRGVTQLTLHVADVRRARALAGARGLPIVMELTEVPEIGVAAFFTRDIDGTLIEIIQADWV